MKIAIIQFPGSNCEAESIRAIEEAGMQAVPFLWNEDYKKLETMDGYFIIGGFSYEDRSRAGVIASLDPVMKVIKVESEKGKPVLGICNGAQVLVETGLVPGIKNNEIGVGLAVNERIKDGKVIGTGFYNAWVDMKLTAPSTSSAFTRHLWEGQVMNLPIAHAEGKFVMSDKLLDELYKNNQTVFRYCDGDGIISNEFPTNPNGAIDNLAAITNPAGNIMAMMPHPERTAAGQPIFTSMKEYISSNIKVKATKLNTETSKISPMPYRKEKNVFELNTKLIITDNEAKTVEQSLENIGIHASIEKMTHWEMSFDNQESEIKNNIENVVKSGELYNSNKEYVVDNIEPTNGHDRYILIRDKSNVFGESAKQTLTKRLGIEGIEEVKKGTLWKISVARGNIGAVTDQILNSGVLYNQNSQDCYLYHAMDYTDKIRRALSNCLTETNLKVGTKKVGKVRDSYQTDDTMILITTDRQSAFDRVLASVPFKGQVLNKTSAWWFEKTKHIIDNHVIDIPDPNVTVAKKCTVFPVEFVVRGYLTGTTSTSAWTNYQKGVRNFCGNRLPDGMTKNQSFESPIITPTTKDVEHDRSITPEEIVSEGLMSFEEWNYVSKKALELFSFGQKVAKEHGLILVDTKYEFGKDSFGNIFLIDEIHTPDSSRYWLAHSYEQNIAMGKEPDNIDKEFLRLWFKDNCDPYNDTVLPKAPDELVIELSKRYIQLYEMITGQMFDFQDENITAEERIKQNLKPYTSDAPMAFNGHGSEVKEEKKSYKDYMKQPSSLSPIKTSCVLLLGSTKDEGHAKKITDALDEFGISWEQHVSSAHKQAKEAIEILDANKDKNVIYITIAGRSNALSGFVAGNSDKVTIACPPFSDKTDMLVNIHSTIQMPSKVPVMTILEPRNVAIAIDRIIKLSDK